MFSTKELKIKMARMEGLTNDYSHRRNQTWKCITIIYQINEKKRKKKILKGKWGNKKNEHDHEETKHITNKTLYTDFFPP